MPDDYINRLIKEQEELQYRIIALRSFVQESLIFSAMKQEDKQLMLDQEYHMSEYHRTLLRRITRANSR